MRRTQVSFEDWEYESLCAEAEREGRSMASVVREAIGLYLSQKQARGRKRLSSVRGIAADRSALGRDHDRYLYDDSE